LDEKVGWGGCASVPDRRRRRNSRDGRRTVKKKEQQGPTVG
jgi:hypothetical protein